MIQSISRSFFLLSKYPVRVYCIPIYSRVLSPFVYKNYSCYSTKSQSTDPDDVNEKIRHSSLLKVDRQEPKALTAVEKVIRTGRDVSYSGVIVVAFALTGFLIWAIFSEFFSRNSINSIFTRTLKVARGNENVQRVLGEPIRGFGEHTGWNRRRHIDHVRYKVGDDEHIRMEYNVRGQRRLGRVNVDLKKDARGRYQIRYLLIELEGRPAGTVIVQDTR